MECLDRQSFGEFSLVLYDDYLEGLGHLSNIGIRIAFNTIEYSTTVSLEYREALYAVERFRREEYENIEGECAICGEEGVKYQFSMSEFKLHEECRVRLKNDVEQFVDDHSEVIVCRGV